MNSLGSGRVKSTTIDVSANLLTEWFATRSKMRRTALQLQWKSIFLAALLAICLPWLLERRTEALRQTASLGAQLGKGRARLAAITADERRIQPILDAAAMTDTAMRRADAFIGEIIRLCNAAPSGVYFSTIKCDVNGGDATIRCQGEAETEEVLNRFLTEARLAPGTSASRLLAARPSTALGPEGNTFEYQKRVGVGP